MNFIQAFSAFLSPGNLDLVILGSRRRVTSLVASRLFFLLDVEQEAW
jgi:hypothetical protein